MVDRDLGGIVRNRHCHQVTTALPRRILLGLQVLDSDRARSKNGKMPGHSDTDRDPDLIQQHIEVVA